MHIEFSLPTGAGGQSAYYFNTVGSKSTTVECEVFYCLYQNTDLLQGLDLVTQRTGLYSVCHDLALCNTPLDT